MLMFKVTLVPEICLSLDPITKNIKGETFLNQVELYIDIDIDIIS